MRHALVLIGVLAVTGAAATGLTQPPSTPGAAIVDGKTPWTGIIAFVEQTIPNNQQPLSVHIPAIDVHAHIESTGLDAEGAMEEPTDWGRVGWYEHGPLPGERGTAILSGHLDSDVGPAVFWDLRSLKTGDLITVMDAARTPRYFSVTDMRQYGANNVPVEEIFEQTDKHMIVLVTCSGDWKDGLGYDTRLLVYAEAVETDDNGLPMLTTLLP